MVTNLLPEHSGSEMRRHAKEEEEHTEEWGLYKQLILAFLFLRIRSCTHLLYYPPLTFNFV